MSAVTTAPVGAARLARTRPLLRVVRAEWERTLAWTLAVGAVLLLSLGYRNVAASPFAAEEVAHLITGGLGALVLLVVSVGLLVTADLRDEADKLDRIDVRLTRSPASPGATPPGPPSPIGSEPGRAVRLASTGAALVGLVFLTAGWAQAARTADFDRSLTGLPLAVVGFGAITAGAAVYCLAARRVVRGRIAMLLNAGGLSGDSPASEVGADCGREEEWTADGLARFHRRSCPALASASGPPRPVDGPAARLEPCLLCHGEEV